MGTVEREVDKVENMISHRVCEKRKSGFVASPLLGSGFTESQPEWLWAKRLALLQSEMQRGLMGRLELAPDSGMLFVYLKPQQMSFWMRNTPLPLDIGFFDAEGKLREIYQLHPFDETPVATHGNKLQFALEMNQGWFKANDIRPGDQLNLTQLKEALQQRDYRPDQFGLK